MRFVGARGARRVGGGVGREWRAERTRRVGSVSDHWMTSWRSASVSRVAALVPAEPPAFASFFGAPETEARLGGDAGRNGLASNPPTSISDGEDNLEPSSASVASRSSAADRVSIAGEASRGLGPERESEDAYPFNTRLNRVRRARPRDVFPSVGALLALNFRRDGFSALRVRRARSLGRGRAGGLC